MLSVVVLLKRRITAGIGQARTPPEMAGIFRRARAILLLHTISILLLHVLFIYYKQPHPTKSEGKKGMYIMIKVFKFILQMLAFLIIICVIGAAPALPIPWYWWACITGAALLLAVF